LATGQPVGDWFDRGEDISSGVASTAGIAAGGVGLFNWATAPTAAAPTAATPAAAVNTGSVTPGWEISTYRQTTAGESFIRYESGNPDYTQISSEGGVLPQTFAAPSSEGLLPQSELGVQYDLPNPQIPRQVYYQLQPPEGTWIQGPRPVPNAPGNEVVFPYGSAPGTATGPFPTPTH
jgi:hypothetical protein